tara:strand:+ start:447 stop:2072 length:1626 start_codon:yes stop_codon:yes gene_type:complete
MTNITSTVRWKSYTGNGSAGPFEFAFQVNAYTEVKVYVDSTLKTAGSHYNVENSSSETSKINTDGTGRVRFTSSNFPTSSQTITIVSNVPLARTSVYTTGGPVTAASLETDFDTSLMVQQQIDKKLDRALVAPEYDIDTINMTLPAKASRLGTVLGFNATTGNPEAGPTIANVNSLSAITTNINTVAGVASNVTTVAGISSNVTTVAGIASNVTTVAGVASLITSDFVSDLNTLATSDIVSDLNTLATSDVVSDLNTLATSDIVSDLNKLATDDIVSDLNTLATTDIVSDLNTLATSDIVTDLNLLATSAIVEDLNLLATSSVIADMASLAGSGANPNITSLTASGEIAAASLDISGNVDVDGTLEADAMTLNGTAITTTATLSTGISNGNLPVFTSGVADDDFLRVSGTSIEGRSASEVLSDIGGQASLTFGISNTNAVKVDSSSVADDEYARFTANGLESRSTSEVLSDIGAQASLTFGISNTNAVKIDSASVADDEYARFTANGLESRSTSEVLSDIGATTATAASDEATALAIALGG